MSWPAAAALTGSLVATGLLLTMVIGLVWFLDRYDRASLWLVGGVLVWGLVVAPLLDSAARAWLSSGGQGAASTVLSILAGATWRGVVKAVPLLLIALYSRSFDSPADGFVYGTSVGVAFAIPLVASGQLMGAQDPATTVIVAVADAVTTVGANALAGAALGVCVGAAVLAQQTTSRIAWGIGGLAGATVLQASAELGERWGIGLPAGIEGWLALAAIQTILYVAVLAGVLITEQRILRERLQEEVDLATVPPWVVDVIPYYRSRIRSDWWPRRSERTVLCRLLTRLAFRRHALGRPANERARLAGLELVQLRHRIRQALGPPPSHDGL